MTHLGFVAVAYALGVALPVVFGIDALLRSGRARRRLAAIDPRQAGSRSA